MTVPDGLTTRGCFAPGKVVTLEDLAAIEAFAKNANDQFLLDKAAAATARINTSTPVSDQ
jgi:hypothetical protein